MYMQIISAWSNANALCFKRSVNLLLDLSGRRRSDLDDRTCDRKPSFDVSDTATFTERLLHPSNTLGSLA